MTITKREPSFKKAFISRILGKQTNWPREMKIMNKLSLVYPDAPFWDGLNPKFKIPSLAWFLVPNGEKFLKEEWAKFKFHPEQVKKFEIEEDIEKLPNSAIIHKDPKKEKMKSINDFLKIWKK